MTLRFFISGKLISLYVFIQCLFAATTTIAQKAKADSLRRLLIIEKTDSNRVRLMWQLAGAMGAYDPDTAQYLSQQSLYLSRSLNYLEGESRSLGVLANTLTKIGNYPRALELNLQKLKLEEKREKPRNLASVLMNIGVVYVSQEDYTQALSYYRQADSVIQSRNVEDMKYYINLNIGDVYNRLNQSDSAFRYFNTSLYLARELDDGDLIGTSMTGLGHSYQKLGNYPLSLENYREAIRLLQAANDDEILCEALLGLAELYEKTGREDSAAYYATASMRLAKSAGFLSKELEAAEFLTGHYQHERSIDSAFLYINYVRGLNDSVYSKSRIRESQVISSNEHFRQLELEEVKRKEKAERFQQLQMLLIAIFIPGFFLITLVLSRANVHIRVIRVLGALSLLFLFEYLTLLLHPTVAALTHHTPVYEILIFVVIAAILIPLHHKLEHWFIHKLIHHRHGQIKHDRLPEQTTHAPENTQPVSPAVENKNVPAEIKKPEHKNKKK